MVFSFLNKVELERFTGTNFKDFALPNNGDLPRQNGLIIVMNFRCFAHEKYVPKIGEMLSFYR